jgi:hypothetical protein
MVAALRGLAALGLEGALLFGPDALYIGNYRSYLLVAENVAKAWHGASEIGDDGLNTLFCDFKKLLVGMMPGMPGFIVGRSRE